VPNEVSAKMKGMIIFSYDFRFCPWLIMHADSVLGLSHGVHMGDIVDVSEPNTCTSETSIRSPHIYAM
jgi:hypothetical protein